MQPLSISILLFVNFVLISADLPPDYTYEQVSLYDGTTAFIPLPQVATYRRTVRNAKGKEIEHLYRVCNGKNKKTCGYWENTQTKKKVASGVTTYNKNKKQLVFKNFRTSDVGLYMTGNKKKRVEVRVDFQIYGKFNETLQFYFPPSSTYLRIVKNADWEDVEQLYRVCDGTNEKTCGYWEDNMTKKKVKSGKFTFDKNGKSLKIDNLQLSDDGTYMTGNKSYTFIVNVFT